MCAKVCITALIVTMGCAGYVNIAASREQGCIYTRKSIEEAAKRAIEMFFIDTVDRYVEPDDLDCEISELLSDDPDINIVVYGTRISTLTLDAGDIIAQECESQELHESVFESIGDKQTKELQELLDKWTAENAHCKTYWPDYNIVIVTERPVTP